MQLGNRLRSPLVFAISVGVAFGVWNLVTSILNPLAQDSPGALLKFYGPMFALWAVAGFLAFSESHRLRDAASRGAVVALVSFIVFTIFVGVRDNLLLDQLTARDDWQNMVARFHQSGSRSLRSYVNFVGLTGAPFKLSVATAIGAVMGFLGGVVAKGSKSSLAISRS